MWIFLSIVLFLGLVITAILLLPVYVTIKTDQNGELYLRYKILHKTFGENSNPNNPLVKTLKSASGITRLQKDRFKTNIEKTNLLTTLRDSFSLIVDLLKELVGLLKYCKAKVFKLNIVCADTDAAEAAITYGECCAIAAPVLGYLHSLINIKPSGENINISCNYNSEKSSFYFETVLVIRVCRILAAFLRVIFAEAKRIAKNRSLEQQAKDPTNSNKSQG